MMPLQRRVQEKTIHEHGEPIGMAYVRGPYRVEVRFDAEGKTWFAAHQSRPRGKQTEENMRLQGLAAGYGHPHDLAQIRNLIGAWEAAEKKRPSERRKEAPGLRSKRDDLPETFRARRDLTRMLAVNALEHDGHHYLVSFDKQGQLAFISPHPHAQGARLSVDRPLYELLKEVYNKHRPHA